MEERHIARVAQLVELRSYAEIQGKTEVVGSIPTARIHIFFISYVSKGTIYYKEKFNLRQYEITY